MASLDSLSTDGVEVSVMDLPTKEGTAITSIIIQPRVEPAYGHRPSRHLHVVNEGDEGDETVAAGEYATMTMDEAIKRYEAVERNVCGPTLLLGFADKDDTDDYIREALFEQVEEMNPAVAARLGNGSLEWLIEWLDQRAPDGWYFGIGDDTDQYGFWPCDYA